MFTRLLVCFLSLLSTSAPLFAQWEWADNSQASSNYERVEDVVVDDTRGVIYSVGFLTGNPSFSEIPGSSLYGGEDGFVMKYDLSGNVLWAFPIGGTSDDRVQGVTVDEVTGNIYITGYIQGSNASNGTKLTGISGGSSGNVSGTSGGQDAFVAKYNTSGQLLWYRIIGGSGLDRGMDIDVNGAYVFMNGIYTNNSILGTLIPILPFGGEINNFVVALNPANGNTVWDAVLASTSDDYDVPSNNSTTKSIGITADDDGFYLVTYFNGSVYRVYNGSGNLSASISDPNGSDADFVVTSYTNAGAHNWSVLYDNEGADCYGLDITNDCSGVYVSGTLHNGGITPGGTVISSTHDDVILSKLNKLNGNEIWLKEFNSSTNHYDHFIGIDADGYGNLYAVGRLLGTSLSLGSDFNYSGGQNYSELMIAHFHTDGAFQSFEVIPSSATSWGMSVSSYRNEKYIVGGYYNNTITFGSVVPDNSVDNAFVAVRNLPSAIDFVTSANSTFSGDAVFCQFEGTATPGINVPIGGTFSAPTEVSINASTGEIDLTASVPGGPYTISYSGTTLSCGEGPFTSDIYILADQDPSFTYTDTTFCKNAPNPSAATIALPGGTFTGSPGLVIENSSTGEINVAASTLGGPYYLIYTTPSPYCPRSDSIQVYVADAPVPNFGYSNSSYCGGTGSTSPTFINTTGGTFSAPAGLVLNPSTGEINLNTSTPGVYDVQYLVSNSGCEDSMSFSITIVQPDDASFTFTNDHLCDNEPNVIPSSIANPGGVFFAPTGLTVSNASTGEIGSSVSVVGGPYQLFYTTSGGTCPGTDSLELFIEAAPDASFSYAQSFYCAESGTVLPSTVGTSGGTFSASPAGLVILDTGTGEIDIDASTVGTTFVIKYYVSNAYCEDSSTFNLIILPNEDPLFTYAGDHFCKNEPNPSAASTAVSGGSFSGPSELVFANPSTGEINVSASTSGGPYYLVHTTGGSSCPSQDSIQVYIEDEPDPTFSYSQATYCSGTGTIVPNSIATPTGGMFSATPAGIDFVNASTGEIDLNTSTPGSYTIKYVVANTYCEDSSTVSLTIEETEDASFTYVVDHFCKNEPNPSAATIFMAGGTFSGPTELVFANPSTGEINVSASTAGGPYYLVYTTSTALCADSDSIQVYIEDEPDPAFSYSQATYCSGTGTIVPNSIATPTGGIFSAVPAGIDFVNASTGEIDLNTSIPGSYTIKYVVANTYCEDSSTVSLTIDQTEDATFTYVVDHFCKNEPNPSADNIVMAGGTFSGPTELVFANPSTGEINVSASTAGGPYYLVYTTSTALCADSDSIQVYIEDEPDPAFSYSQATYCSGTGTIVPNSIATPTGGMFSATPAGIDFVNASTGEIDLNTSTPGSYTIKYVVANTYCEDSSTVSLTIDQTEDASFTYVVDHFCKNESNPSPDNIVMAGGTFTGPTELVFANASTGEINVAASTAGGPYYLVYTTSTALCADSDSIQVYIEDEPDPAFSYSQATYCSGTGTIVPNSIATPTGGMFSATPAGIDFVNASTGEIDLNTSIPGSYTIKYVVANTYCEDSSTVSLTIYQTEDATFTYLVDDFCTNEANPSASFIALPGGTFIGSTGLMFANSGTGEVDIAGSTVGGPYMIYYTTNGTNCPATDSLEVDIVDPPDATFTYGQTLYCSGSGTIIPDFVAVPGGTFSAPAGIDLVDITTGEININTSAAGGPYTIQYTVSNAYCEETSTFDLTIEQTEDASFTYSGGTHFCYNESNPVPTTTTPGGTFSGSAGLIMDNGSGEIDALNTPIGGPYEVIYATNGANCPSSDTIEVYIEGAPDPSFSYAQTSYCQGAGIIVTPNSIATTGGTFSGPAALSLNSADGTINVDASTAGGPYTIQYLVANMYCQKSTTFTVTILGQDNLVSVDYSSNEYCVSESNQIPVITGVTGGVFSGPTSIDLVNTSTGEFSPSTSGTGGPFLIQYVTPGVCPDSIEIPIMIYEVPTAYAGEDQTLYYVFSSFLDGDAAVVGFGEWTTTSSALIGDEYSPNAEVTELALGKNTFVWTVTNGVCPSASDEMIIDIEGIYIPQAVTPNNDGKNDFFELHSLDEVTCSLQLFNRWGQIIYENSDYQNEWFGQNAKGELLENDTYFYVILINDTISYNGYVVLKK